MKTAPEEAKHTDKIGLKNPVVKKFTLDKKRLEKRKGLDLEALKSHTGENKARLHDLWQERLNPPALLGLEVREHTEANGKTRDVLYVKISNAETTLKMRKNEKTKQDERVYEVFPRRLNRVCEALKEQYGEKNIEIKSPSSSFKSLEIQIEIPKTLNNKEKVNFPNTVLAFINERTGYGLSQEQIAGEEAKLKAVREQHFARRNARFV